MDFAGAIKSGLVNWNKFSGTASKAEYWYFYLFSWILGQVVNLVDLIVQPHLRNAELAGDALPTAAQLLSMIPIPSLIVSLLILVPQLAVTYRRIQDGGRPGWLSLLQFVPLVCAFAFLAILFSTWGQLDAPGFVGLLALALFTLAASIAWLVLWLIWTLAPTKTAEQGNKYAN